MSPRAASWSGASRSAGYRKPTEFKNNPCPLQPRENQALKTGQQISGVEIRIRQRVLTWQSEITAGSRGVARNSNTERNRGKKVGLSTGHRE